MRVYVAGARDYGQTAGEIVLLNERLTALHSPGNKITELVQGGQAQWDKDLRQWLGADYWAMRWASANGVVYITLKPQWTLNGRAAGPIRNQALLDRYPPDLALFTRGGPGTEGAKKYAEQCGYAIEDLVSGSVS